MRGGEWGVPDDYEGLGLVDHTSSGDSDVHVCVCASVFTAMLVLTCQYVLVCQKRQWGAVHSPAALKVRGKSVEKTQRELSNTHTQCG